MAEEKIYHYPVWIRLWHLLNALLCLFLIVTGISMQFSNPDFPLIRFDLAVSIHNIAGILLTINYVIFFTGNLFTSNGRYYKPVYRGFSRQLAGQFRYYTRGIFRRETPPYPITVERKFNPLQQFSYVLMMYLVVPLSFITGFALMYPEIIPLRIFWSSGLHFTDLVHVISAFIISMFMFIHIYFCTIGKTAVSNFKSLVDGYQESH